MRALSAILLTAPAAIASIPFYPDILGDAPMYREMAAGHMASVPRPFANRILLPFLVAAIHRISGADISVGFFAVGVICFLVFTFVVLDLGRSERWNDPSAALLVATPGAYAWLASHAQIEILHAPLLALFFLSIREGKRLSAVLLLFLLVLTRESSLLLAAIAVLVLLTARERRFAAGIAVAAAAALLTVRVATRNALPNIHGMNEGIYLVLKIPFNLTRNMLGFPVWIPSFSWSCDALLSLHRGSRTISVCHFDVGFVANTYSAYAMVFGILPTLLFVGWRRGRLPAFSKLPAEIQIALCYGLISWAIAPLLGAGTGRLMTAGWPAFWFVLPRLLPPWQSRSPRILRAILLLNLAASWMSTWQFFEFTPHGYAVLAVCWIVCIAAHVIGYRLFSRALVATPGAAAEA